MLLSAASTEGPGIFDKVTFIQRVNTVGGNAPDVPGEFTGQMVRVPYSADYYFFTGGAGGTGGSGGSGGGGGSGGAGGGTGGTSG